MRRRNYTGCLSATSPRLPFIATLYCSASNSTLLIYNAEAPLDAPYLLYTLPIDTTFGPICTSIRFCHSSSPSNTDPSQASSTARILLASDSTLHVYDALNRDYHMSISNAAYPSPRFSDALLVSPDEVLTIPDLAPKSTIWDLRTGTGVEIRDPKPGLRGNAYSIRRSSGHIALLTRPESAAQRDIILILGAGPEGLGRQVEAEFPLDTYDARGLKWSKDGKWLVVWDAPSMGSTLWVYTADGQMYKRWDDGGGEDGVGLGIERLSWDINGNLCVAMCDGRIVILQATSFVTRATSRHRQVVDNLPSSASVHQEQFEVQDADLAGVKDSRSYAPATLPAALPAPPANGTSRSADTANGTIPRGINHLVASPLSPLLASVAAASPTTIHITSLAPKVQSRAIIIHHSPIKSLDWHPQRAGWLLIQCSHTTPYTTSPLTTAPNTLPDPPSSHAVYVWSDDLPDPMIISIPYPSLPQPPASNKPTTTASTSLTSRPKTSSTTTNTNGTSSTSTATNTTAAHPPAVTASWIPTSASSPLDSIPNILFSTVNGSFSLPAFPPSSPTPSEASLSPFPDEIDSQGEAEGVAGGENGEFPLPSPRRSGLASAFDDQPTPKVRLFSGRSAAAEERGEGADDDDDDDAAEHQAEAEAALLVTPTPAPRFAHHRQQQQHPQRQKRPITPPQAGAGAKSKPNPKSKAKATTKSPPKSPQKTPIKGFGPEDAFDEGESFVDVEGAAVDMAAVGLGASVMGRSAAGASEAEGSVDWQGGMVFSPVRFDVGEWTRTGNWTATTTTNAGAGMRKGG